MQHLLAPPFFSSVAFFFLFFLHCCVFSEKLSFFQNLISPTFKMRSDITGWKPGRDYVVTLFPQRVCVPDSAVALTILQPELKCRSDRLSFMFEGSFMQPGLIQRGLSILKGDFLFLLLHWCKWVTAVCQQPLKIKRKNKVRDVDVVVCVFVPFYLQATRPVSSSPQSSRRESRLCGGSASNARLAAAVKIKERTRWVDELIWPTGSGCSALFFTRVPDRDADRRVWVILVSLDTISSGGWLLFKCLSWGLTVGGDTQPATICALSKTEKQQSCSKQPLSVVTRQTAKLLQIYLCLNCVWRCIHWLILMD